MSRHYLWVYTIAGSPVVSAMRSDMYFEDNCAGINHTHCQGGAGGIVPRLDLVTWQSEIWLWANKAKARRLAAHLDAYFGEPGQLGLSEHEEQTS